MNNMSLLSVFKAGHYTAQDAECFERTHSGLVSAMRSGDMDSAQLDQLNTMIGAGGKDSYSAALLAAKHMQTGSEAKKIAIQAVKAQIDFAFDPENLFPSQGEAFVDSVVQFLPLNQPVFKELRDHIKSWQISESSWRYAREQSKLDL